MRSDTSQVPPMDEIRALVEREFPVEQLTLEHGVPIFTVRIQGNVKDNFLRLVEAMKPHGLIPLIRRRGDSTVILALGKPTRRKGKRITPILLLALTFTTVLVSGYLFSSFWVSQYKANQYVHALLFTAALMGIVGLHEFGHKMAARLNNIKATQPYFIPGPPPPFGFGTLGAIIMQREPPLNRDQLFDLGFSGPAVGFIVTLIVAVAAIMTSQVEPLSSIERVREQGTIFLNPPVIWMFIADILRPVPQGFILLTPPIAVAAWVGFVITFLNLLPVWQLDGGHITRAMFGEKSHRISAIIGIVIAFITGFWFFGVLILFFMASSPRAIGILDDVSPLTFRRKILGITTYVMLGLSAVLLWPLEF